MMPVMPDPRYRLPIPTDESINYRGWSWLSNLQGGLPNSHSSKTVKAGYTQISLQPNLPGSF